MVQKYNFLSYCSLFLLMFHLMIRHDTLKNEHMTYAGITFSSDKN